MIYEECLVVIDEINPHPLYHEIPRVMHPDASRSMLAKAMQKPVVAILRVNKQIGTEATKVLYGKNVVRLTTDSYPRGWLRYEYTEDHDPYESVFNGPSLPVRWIPKAELVRHFVASLDFCDVHPQEIGRITEVWWFQAVSMSKPDRARWIHNIRLKHLGNMFETRLRMLQYLPQRPSIEINLNQCYCLNGCCRAIRPQLWGSIMATFSKLTLTGILECHEDMCLLMGLERRGIEFNVEVQDKALTDGDFTDSGTVKEPWLLRENARASRSKARIREWSPLEQSVTETWNAATAGRTQVTLRYQGGPTFDRLYRLFKKGYYGWIVISVPYAESCSDDCSSICQVW